MRASSRTRVGTIEAPFHPRDALADPECDVELWWRMAETYPFEAQESVLYPLLTLEEPGRWEDLRREHIASWLSVYAGYILRLTPRLHRLFSADCTEHVLPSFERQYPGNTVVRDAIEAVRAYAQGLMTGAWLQVAGQRAYQARLTAEKASAAAGSTPAASQYQAAGCAAQAAERAAGYASHRGDVSAGDGMAKTATIMSIESAQSAAFAAGRPKGDAALYAERVWQWERLCWYLQGEQVGLHRRHP
jgi:hypothetical protein